MHVNLTDNEVIGLFSLLGHGTRLTTLRKIGLENFANKLSEEIEQIDSPSCSCCGQRIPPAYVHWDTMAGLIDE